MTKIQRRLAIQALAVGVATHNLGKALKGAYLLCSQAGRQKLVAMKITKVAFADKGNVSIYEFHGKINNKSICIRITIRPEQKPAKTKFTPPFIPDRRLGVKSEAFDKISDIVKVLIAAASAVCMYLS